MSRNQPKHTPAPLQKPAPKPVIPAPPKGGMPQQSPLKKAATFLDQSDAKGGHNRSQHVGKTAAELKGRNLSTATSYLSKADQNLATKSAMASPQFGATKNAVAMGKNNNKIAVKTPTTGGRLQPIVKVVVKNPNGTTSTFNAKASETTTVLKKGPGGVRAQTTFAEKGQALPKPLPGGKVPTSKVAINKIGEGAQGQLRKVGAPAAKPLSMVNNDGNTQKRFQGVTKNALPPAKTPGKK
jgi:hypothetical protein